MARALIQDPAWPAVILALVAGVLWLPAWRTVMWPALSQGRLGGAVVVTTVIVVTAYSAALAVSSLISA
jgi:cytochrome c biogenesis protein CcdA